jgi:formate hydrogenlyase subunit 6/NADH:ubiquinone oxidoreductase subunit I
MFKTLKARIYQGYQAIPDIRKAEINPKFRGKPEITLENCNKCGKCASICPTNAINEDRKSVV